MAGKKKNKSAASASDSLFDKVAEMLSSEHGKSIVNTINTISQRPTFSYSTGSLSLDYIISPSMGGIEIGRALEFWGEFSTGKTTLALGICLNIIAQGKKVVFIDAESSLQSSLVLNVGIDKDSFYVIEHLDARESANALIKLIMTGEVGGVVIDSLPAWKPFPDGTKKEDDPDMTRERMAAQSSFLSTTLPYVLHFCKEHGTVFISINQARKNIGGYMPIKPAGGTVQEHLMNARLKLTGRAFTKQDGIVDAVSKKTIGQWVTVTADKNKLDMPHKKLRVPLILGVGVNPYMELAELAGVTGVLQSTSGWYKYPGSDENLAHGFDQLSQKLFDEPDLYLKLRGEVCQALGVVYKPGCEPVNPYMYADGTKRQLIYTPEEVKTVNGI